MQPFVEQRLVAGREATAYCQALEVHWPPSAPFASQADPAVRACAVLAKAVYLQKDAIPDYIEQMGVGPMVDGKVGAHIWTLETAVDAQGEVQFAFFALLHPPNLITWTVARGSACKSDWILNGKYLLSGRPYESPDFLRLLTLHDTNCQRTESSGHGISGFRRFAVGHSKAGAEVVELGLARPDVEVHAFNDGGLHNLNALRVRLSGLRVFCHRVYGDIVSNLRFPVGSTAYYPRDPKARDAHSMDNFTPSDSILLPRTTPLAWPVGLLVARTTDAVGLSQSTEREFTTLPAPAFLHPTQHGIQLLGIWLASLATSATHYQGFSWLGLRGATACALHSFVRSLVAQGSPCRQARMVGMLHVIESLVLASHRPCTLHRLPCVLCDCVSVSSAAYCLAAYSSSRQGLGFLVAAIVSRALPPVALATAKVAYRVGMRKKRGQLQEVEESVCLDAVKTALVATRSMAAAYVGSAYGAAIGGQLGALIGLPLCVAVGKGASGAAHLPCAVLLRHWAGREVGTIVGAQWGASFCSTSPWSSAVLLLYGIVVGYAALPLARSSSSLFPK
eukprot:TRINITY_DN34869_c0_g1_i1.p1 TRINITY_DN34869_c0_g1~~TRINITY_DN34869_c0_g1_i1.p1  ORF type:complete len:563 (-),score=46.73 TRINITY_DN34869_c0_g1_i1:120-1808(-)